MTTQLDTKSYSEGHTEVKEQPLDEDNLHREILDTSRPLETRLKALALYSERQGKENTIEVINTLGMMYELSGTRSLRQYLYDICTNSSSIDPFLKTFSAKALWSHNKEDELGYQAISTIYPDLGSASTPYKLDLLKILMRNEKYQNEAKDHFCQIINDNKLDCQYRYKTILSLEKGIGQEMEAEEQIKINVEYLVKEACYQFARKEDNVTQYRILSCQNYLRLCGEKKENIIEILFSLANDVKLEYNLRADATDVILQYGDAEHKEKARRIILDLGSQGGRPTTVYNNAQNVHVEEIEASVLEGLEFLQNLKLMIVQGGDITFDYVKDKIVDLCRDKTEEIREKVGVSLNRIECDRALYSRYNLSLIHVLLRLWTYICDHASEEELKKRLVEELLEMAGTCSSGFATRLVNVMSGFGDFSIRISWRDQISGNLTARLNTRIQNMDDLRLQGKVLEEMTLDTGDHEKRKHFLKFLRKNISEIREELYEEYKTHISDSDFDLYFRGALSIYETGQAS